MNAAIASAVRTQAANTETAAKLERETVKSAEQAAGGQNTAAETSVSSKYDTLDLSRKYLEYRTQTENRALQDETSQLNSTVVKKASYKDSYDMKDALDAKEASDKSNQTLSYYNPVYSYTEFELKEMRDNGTISKAEYEAELAEKETKFEAV